MTNSPAPNLPPSLQSLLDKLGLEVADFTLELEQQDRTVDSWQRDMESALTRYHLAAYMTGQDSPVFDRQGVATVQGLVTAQLEFLDNFALVIKDGSEWQRSWNARAAMYAESIKVPYWRGATKVLPLPAMPAEGTQCRTRCRCLWSVVTVDEDQGDYDATWIRGAGDSCQTCVQRAGDWSPLRIRGGRLV
jgi:hypothetical protein